MYRKVAFSIHIIWVIYRKLSFSILCLNNHTSQKNIKKSADKKIFYTGFGSISISLKDLQNNQTKTYPKTLLLKISRTFLILRSTSSICPRILAICSAEKYLGIWLKYLKSSTSAFADFLIR